MTYQLLRATPHFYTSIRPVSRAGVCMCVCDLPCLSGCPAAQDWAASHCLFASAATAADYCLLTLTHCGACRKVVPSNMSCILTTTAASLFSSQTPCRFHLPLPRCRSRSLPRKYSYLHTNFSPPFSPGDFSVGMSDISLTYEAWTVLLYAAQLFADFSSCRRSWRLSILRSHGTVGRICWPSCVALST